MSSRNYLGYAFLSAALLIGVMACDSSGNSFTLDYSIAEDNLISIEGINPDTTESGFYIYFVKEGEGLFELTARDNILLHYTIRIKNDDRIIESSYVNGSTQPFQFSVAADFGESRGSGFLEGMIGMKEGEQRVLIIPPDDDLEVSFFVDTVIVDYELDSILY